MPVSYQDSADIMEPGNISSNASATNAAAAPMSCAEYKENLISGLQPYQILIYLNPVDNTIWTDRDLSWRSAFKVYIGLIGSVYLLLGIMSIFMLIKKDCIRLATKTFFAVYTTIAVLGFSRALQLALDPYDLLGFISNNFQPWLIITRLLGSLGFPSLVASYTLMVFTLLKIAKANPGKQWYHRWRYVIPIVVLPYVIAITAEVIGYLAEYPGFLSVIVCEATFGLWGITVCITYMIAGGRLMHQLRRRERNTVRMSSSRPPEGAASRTDFAAQEYERHHKHNRRTARKIGIITYGTVIVAVIYSFFTFGNIIMVCLFLFKECLGFTGMRGNSDAWLVIHILTRVTEITLSVIMLYSITDVSGVMKLVSRMCIATCCGCKRMRVTECTNRPHSLEMAKMLNNNTSSQANILANSHDEVLISREDAANRAITTTGISTDAIFSNQGEITGEEVILERNEVSNHGDSGIQLEAVTSGQKNNPSTRSSILLSSSPPKTFLLNASKGESSSSIESNALPTITVHEDTQGQATASKQHETPLSVAVLTNILPLETSEECSNSDSGGERHDVMESHEQNKALQPGHGDSILSDSRSPVHVLEQVHVHVQTLTIDTESERDIMSDKACQTEGRDKPVPKLRRFAPRSPRERRQNLREQKQHLAGESSLNSNLKRQQTV